MLKDFDCTTPNVAYNRWHDKVHGHENPRELHLECWHRSALSLAPDLCGLKVLEVGCGVGDFTIYLSGQKAEVSAVDFSSKAIEIARAKARAQNKQVAFEVGDAAGLPFRDDSFDILFSCECLEHVPTPQRVIEEFYRVLKPSGRLILTTENYSNAMVLAWIVSWLRKEPFNSGAGVQPIEHFYLYWKIKRLLRSSGFKVSRMRGTHHVFLLLPGFDPSSFTKVRFDNALLAKIFRPLARHMAFEAIK